MTPGYRLVVLLLAAAVPSATGTEWSYKDTSQWPGACQTGNQQSPIDLSSITAQVAQFDKFTFANYDAATRVNLINNGHTVELGLEKPTSCALSGGGLPGVYYMSNMHFHWAAEHTVQGRRYPLEMHMVHYSKLYSDVTAALKDKQGVAVVGILFKESNETNQKLEPLLSILDAVNGNVNIKVPLTVTPADYLPGDVSAFYRYQGSLTTPGCNESVVWTVMMATVPASRHQLDRFVKLKGEHGKIGENYRPVQQLNGRIVYVSKPPASSAPGLVYAISPVTLIFVPFFIVFI